MELDKPNIEINWHRTKLPRETLVQLNERSDWLGFAQTGGFLLTMLLTGSLSFYFWLVQSWGLFAICLFAHGTVTSFCINAVHELVHGTVFKTKWLNGFFANIFGFIGIINPHMFWYSHAEHHKYTLHPPDDLEVTLPVYHSTGKYLTSFLINFHFYHEFVALFRYCLGKFRDPWETVIVPDKALNRKRKVINWSRTALLLHLAILVISVWSGLWIIPVLTTFTGAYGAWLFYLCNFTQHAGLTENINDFRLNCRTILLNPVTRFLYWHMNWHIEHHMYAAVPCYRLHKLHKAIQHELPHCPRGLIEAWVKIAYIQYRRVRDPEYRFIPELPDKDGKFSSETSRLQQIRQQAEQRLNDKTKTQPTTVWGRRWECKVCGFIYDESRGLPEEGIAPGTAWEDVPDDWHCPDCGVSKAEFDMVELPPDHKIDDAAMDLESMVSKKAPLIIIGSGMAGYGLAREVRMLDAHRPITILTSDDGRAYSKPSLSNALAKERSVDDLVSATAPEMAHKLKIRIESHCLVKKIDRSTKKIFTSTGEFNYSELVLALGADAIRLPGELRGADRVLSVNDLNDYDAFRKKLIPTSRVVIIGDGLIGCEFANDLALAGHSVHLVGHSSQPLNRLVPPAIGQALRTQLEKHKVTFYSHNSLESVSQDFTCQLADGTSIQADVVLSAIGLQPRTLLAQEAQLKVGRGISVDDFLRTSDSAIYALGDCAEHDGVLRPFVAPLTIGLHCLAKTLTGQETAAVYPVMPVVIKTPALPIVVVPPPQVQEGEWVVSGAPPNLEALFLSPEKEVLAFALSGTACERKEELISELNRLPSLTH